MSETRETQFPSLEEILACEKRLSEHHDAANGRLPCRKCGVPHAFKPGPHPTYGSWAAPDGHAYYPVNYEAFLLALLSKQTGRDGAAIVDEYAEDLRRLANG